MGAESQNHFYQVHNKARFHDLMARITGRSNDLLPFDALAGVLQHHQHLPRAKSEMIPLASIVGSVGRYRDFTRDFLPRTAAMAQRWARIEEGMAAPLGLPPIDVFKIGDVYFVADGNHRVSVARANGFTSIDAYVTDIPVDAGIEPGDSLDEAIIKAGRARFMEETGLLPLIERYDDIRFSSPGGHLALLEQVKAHRRQKSAELGVDVPLAESAPSWYCDVYRPIVALIRELELLHHFPGRTSADLYVWVSRYVLELSRIYSEPISVSEAAQTLSLTAPSPFQVAVQEFMRRLGRFSRVFNRAATDVPEWAMPTAEIEWDSPPLTLTRETDEPQQS